MDAFRVFQVFGIGSGGGEVDATVLKKEEEALITLMKERAVKRCRDSQRAYYECVKPRTISIVWACREQANTMNDCLHDHTSEEVLAELKARWVCAGKPTFADRDEKRIRRWADDEKSSRLR